MRALVSAAVQRDPGLTPLLQAIELARWDDLPDACLPWERVAALAQEQGIGEADVVWDLASGMPAQPTPQAEPAEPVIQAWRQLPPGLGSPEGA
ncbi:MAG TPA: hypothetical protein VI111_08925 [Thermoleophilaceae bacterium]